MTPISSVAKSHSLAVTGPVGRADRDLVRAVLDPTIRNLWDETDP